MGSSKFNSEKYKQNKTKEKENQQTQNQSMRNLTTTFGKDCAIFIVRCAYKQK